MLSIHNACVYIIIIYVWVSSVAYVQHTNDVIANQGEPCVRNCEYLAYLCPAIAYIRSSRAAPCLVCVTIPDACMHAESELFVYSIYRTQMKVIDLRKTVHDGAVPVQESCM